MIYVPSEAVELSSVIGGGCERKRSSAQLLAAVVVTYNPDSVGIRATLTAIASQVDRVFVVDNSDRSTELGDVLRGFNNVVYVNNGGNQGIAHALNRGLAEAAAFGAGYIVTLDQDSSLPSGYVALLKDYVMSRADVAVVGIVGGAYYTPGVRPPEFASVSSGEVRSLITSGNLLNVAIAQSIGGFREELFIDYVDMDICFRLRLHGFKVIQHPTASFAHQLGDGQPMRLFGYSFVAYNHSAFRRYFITRNRLVFYKDFFKFSPKYVVYDAYLLFKETAKVLMVEDDKRKKLRAILSGVADAFRGRLGKCPHRF